MSGAKIMQSMNQYSMIERSDHLVDRGWRTSYSSSASSGGKASAAAAISAQAESNSNLTPQKSTPADIREHLRLLRSRIRSTSRVTDIPPPSRTTATPATRSTSERISSSSSKSTSSSVQNLASDAGRSTGTFRGSRLNSFAKENSPRVQPRIDSAVKRPTKPIRPSVKTPFPDENVDDPFKPRPKIPVGNDSSPITVTETPSHAFDFDSLPAVAGSSNQPILDDGPKPSESCAYCSRRFNVDVLEKHERICAKQKKRPTFDSSAHRLASIQEAQKGSIIANEKAAPKTHVDEPVINVKKASWKEKSDQLRAAIGLARAKNPHERQRYEAELARVNEAALTRCEYCGRSFNAEAAQRHIPFCRNKSLMMPRTSPGKISVPGTGTTVKLPALNRSRSVLSSTKPKPQDPPSAAGYRGLSLIQRHFR